MKLINNKKNGVIFKYLEIKVTNKIDVNIEIKVSINWKPALYHSLHSNFILFLSFQNIEDAKLNVKLFLSLIKYRAEKVYN